ncbi:MAG TPA: hypothetical protein VLC98_05805 [Phnomibacter sp.]|nr:hypothetical protein [Phnomibacter sp.]
MLSILQSWLQTPPFTLNKQQMLKKSSLTVLLTTCTIFAFSQTPIDVTENTVKISASGEEVFYYGFAEGDQVIFNLEELNGKELTEVEIAAMPTSSLFMDYKTKKIENKTLKIPETGVYKFRFTNSNILAGRVCKFKIQRIPESDATKKFNSTVYKRTVYDTTYNDVTERFLVKSDTVVSEILNQVAKVHSQTNTNSNKTITNFTLPENTIAWSYYIGVDQAGQQAYENATKQLVSNSEPIASTLIGTSPISALALGFTSFLSLMQSGEDIDYYLTDGLNANLFNAGQAFRAYKKGKVINDFSKMQPMNGNLSFCFSNDNAVTGVQVILKVSAVQVNGTWDTRQVKKMNIIPRQDLYLKN